ncbi:MAG: hypothetical protein U0694_04695 [Anaerolineae bacterium]
MARPDKMRGFRPMTADDEKYLWRVSRYEDQMMLEILHASSSGQRVVISLRTNGSVDHSAQMMVKPNMVREAVNYALAHGWTPQIAAPAFRVDGQEANLPFVDVVKTPFEATVDDILSRTPLIDASSLQGFELDMRHFLAQGELLTHVSTQKTDDPRCLLLATGELSPTCHDQRLAGEFITKQWLENICYKGFEAHQIYYRSQAIAFHFVTISKAAPYCVSGRVVIAK